MCRSYVNDEDEKWARVFAPSRRDDGIRRFTTLDWGEWVAVVGVGFVVALLLAASLWAVSLLLTLPPVTWADAGLLAFVMVVILDVVALLTDVVLLLAAGIEHTITRWVRRHPPWGIPLVGLQFVGGAGLWVHLYV